MFRVYSQRPKSWCVLYVQSLLNCSRSPESPDTQADPQADPHLEELTITAKLGNTEVIIINVYIPPVGGYNQFLGSSDDDDVHAHTGRLQCSPLVVFKLDRFERHYVGDHGIWL